jgi:hypothetical protein
MAGKEINMRYMVALMMLGLVVGMVAWRASNVNLPDIGQPVAGLLKPKKPKPSTPGSTTTVVTKPDGTTTTVVEVGPVQVRKNRAGVGVSTDLGLKDRVYEFTYERRVLEHVWVGTTVDSTQRIGTTVSIEF